MEEKLFAYIKGNSIKNQIEQFFHFFFKIVFISELEYKYEMMSSGDLIVCYAKCYQIDKLELIHFIIVSRSSIGDIIGH